MMSANPLLIALGTVAAIACLIALSFWGRSHGLAAVRKWAEAQNLHVVSAKRRSFVPLWCSGKGYQFFRVTVRDEGGTTRNAWIRCWDFNSAEPHNLDVIWDK
jgi:hypothetical protein